MCDMQSCCRWIGGSMVGVGVINLIAFLVKDIFGAIFILPSILIALGLVLVCVCSPKRQEQERRNQQRRRQNQHQRDQFLVQGRAPLVAHEIRHPPVHHPVVEPPVVDPVADPPLVDQIVIDPPVEYVPVVDDVVPHPVMAPAHQHAINLSLADQEHAFVHEQKRQRERQRDRDGDVEVQCIKCRRDQFADSSMSIQLEIADCGHRFHIKCLRKQIQKTNICPKCKKELKHKKSQVMMH